MEPTVHFQFDNPEDGLPEDTAVHFRSAQFPVDEDNGYFRYFETAFVSGEFHLNLESITLKAYTCLLYTSPSPRD